MAQKHQDIFKTETESWEFEEARSEEKTFKTNVQKCLVCGVGDVVQHNRGKARNLVLVQTLPCKFLPWILQGEE